MYVPIKRTIYFRLSYICRKGNMNRIPEKLPYTSVCVNGIMIFIYNYKYQ